MSSSDNNYAPPGFTLTFHDEFDGVGQQPDSDNWVYDLGYGNQEGGPGWGWGNGEQQRYQQGAENVQIIDVIDRDPSEADTDGSNDGINGALRIVAAKTGSRLPPPGSSQTSRTSGPTATTKSAPSFPLRRVPGPRSGFWARTDPQAGRTPARSTSSSGPPIVLVQTGLGLSARSITAATPHRALTLATQWWDHARDHGRGVAHLPGLVVSRRGQNRGRRKHRERPPILYKGPERDQRRLAVRPPDGSDHEYRDRRDTGRYCPGK